MIHFKAKKLLQSATEKISLDLSFFLEKNQVLTIYGKSGAGKTTTLRILAGLIKAEDSEIQVDNQIWNSSKQNIHLPIQNRSIGYVFQDFALFPNLTVKENLEYACINNNDKKMIFEVLEMMEISNFKNFKPQNLSGGQQQRVALARAIVRKPKILLLDEPLSALDDDMRIKLQNYILEVHQFYKLTTILVSHHLPEIFKLSNKVIVIENGKISREGTPNQVFSSKNISSKFKLIGQIVNIEKSDVVFIISVLTDNSIVKVVATKQETMNLSIGKKIMLASKAFNPVIFKIE